MSHSINVYEATKQCFETIIKTTQDDLEDGTKQMSQDKAREGTFFQMKRGDIKGASRPVEESHIEPLDGTKCGEDFHNPMFEADMVHTLGRFNQSFCLFKSAFVDSDTLTWCKNQIGRKRGPFACPNELPLDTKMSESIVTALERLQTSKPRDEDLNIPTLFILVAQNYEHFSGKSLNN